MKTEPTTRITIATGSALVIAALAGTYLVLVKSGVAMILVGVVRTLMILLVSVV
jgi:hypothetical protein